MMWPPGGVRASERLSNHTSFRIGGPAEWFAEPSSLDELVQVLQAAWRAGLAVSVVGGGTNLLVPDQGVRGVVVHLGRAFRTVEELAPSSDGKTRVRCGASVLTQRLVSMAAQRGWGDLERLAGLPGQLGGAVVMNAQSIGRFVERITHVSFTGALQQVTHEQLRFAYRYAVIEPGVIVDVTLRFAQINPAVAAEQIHGALDARNSSQEVGAPSAGCAFKNPAGESAGRLIDQAGLKGSRIGDAQVSRRHANFILNVGQATCDDVLSLMEHLQRAVARRMGVWLEPEIRLFGERWAIEQSSYQANSNGSIAR